MKNNLIESLLKVCQTLNGHSVDTLEELGLDVAEFKDEASPDPKRSFFRFEQEAFKLDLLPDIPGLSKFRTSYNTGILITFQEVEMRYLNYDDLIASKKALSRSRTSTTSNN